jgi:hypothetical protein
MIASRDAPLATFYAPCAAEKIDVHRLCAEAIFAAYDGHRHSASIAFPLPAAPQMKTVDYDLITVGGGIGGATLAKVMAEAGYRVLVLERDTEFRDRVRGEVLVPWGCGEAATLGIYDLLRESCGHEIRYWATDFGVL